MVIIIIIIFSRPRMNSHLILRAIVEGLKLFFFHLRLLVRFLSELIGRTRTRASLKNWPWDMWPRIQVDFTPGRPQGRQIETSPIDKIQSSQRPRKGSNLEVNWRVPGDNFLRPRRLRKIIFVVVVVVINWEVSTKKDGSVRPFYLTLFSAFVIYCKQNFELDGSRLIETRRNKRMNSFHFDVSQLSVLEIELWNFIKLKKVVLNRRHVNSEIVEVVFHQYKFKFSRADSNSREFELAKGNFGLSMKVAPRDSRVIFHTDFGIETVRCPKLIYYFNSP